ncbi:hypothetical protein NIES4102_34060 [Chondrocystis sp. NIES-4102]|nr:hypothetical protein NIES4102_34060 [Chondrocystis sp. NIES-4102]
MLRFDLHVENANGGTVDVSMQSDVLGFTDYDLGTIQLIDAAQTVEQYLNDRYKIAYGTEGFETFHLDILYQLKGQEATLTFEVNGNTVYLNDVFFQSKHLAYG